MAKINFLEKSVVSGEDGCKLYRFIGKHVKKDCGFNLSTRKFLARKKQMREVYHL